MGVASFDIGSSNIKYGVFDNGGNLLAMGKEANRTYPHKDGYMYYSADEMWDVCYKLMKELKDKNPDVEAVAITGMSESGLFIDCDTGLPKTPIIPWYDQASVTALPQMEAVESKYEMYRRTGLHLSAKFGLPKILWLRGLYENVDKNAVWLSAPSYIAYKLTGEMGTDPSLAARTFTYDINKRKYDVDFLKEFDLTENQLAPVIPESQGVGNIKPEWREELGVGDIPVCIAGQDHMCSCFAVSVSKPGQMLDSLGTAEALIGLRKEKPMDKDDFEAGIQWAPCPLPDMQFCIAGSITSGGSVEWLRKLNPFFTLEYSHIDAMEDMIDTSPTNILYYPYLSGRGAPVNDPSALAGFLGLSRTHNLADIYKAISQGVSMDVRTMYEAIGLDAKKMIAVGGGTKNKKWMQVKANIMNMPIEVPDVEESAITGAAVVAMVAAGHYPNLTAAIDATKAKMLSVYYPQEEYVKEYEDLYKDKYLKFDNRIFQNK